jgi:class 3 adenylate cyclase/tetratricopeptide (TPR) repeat protein
MQTCPSCGSEQASEARFCSNCGTALQPLGEEQQERRIVTVLFSDLAGSTALGEQLDPEDVRRVQAELFELLNAEVVRFGGTTEKFVGDAVLAVFGIPSAHEDDPERAVRAALAAHERFAGFAERVESRFGLAVGLRTGINTGDVVSGRETAARGELMVSGDAVNVAARLQQAAEPGEILVGPRTQGATSRAVVYGRRREVDAKGKSAPISAWEARAVAAEPAIRASEFSAPLVGREEELTLLEMVAARGRRERVPQLVTLFGPAGVGKSRLVEELLARVPAARTLKGRCLPYGEGITYWPLAEAAKGEADILDTDPVEVAHEKLRTAVHAAVEQGAHEVFDSIAWTIGLATDDSPLTAMDTPTVGTVLADGWQRYVGALGRSALTVLVIEDIHWASAALLDLVEHLVDRISDSCVLLICTARPEFLAEHPSWGAGKQNATALSLTPLTAEESERLVSNLLGDARVPDDVRRPLLSSAEGNPFFLEEMLQMLIDEGALQRENGGWEATLRLAELRIPDSVHGVIAARLDLLDPGAREALRRCAVVGRVFWPAAVGVDEELVASLTGTGLVSLQPVSVMGGLQEFTFKHALTRDVAYGSLARSERRELHLQVAEWIQHVGPGRDVETAELAAYHYREAIGYGEDDPEILRSTYAVLMAAGERATRRAALAAAQEQLEAALELAGTVDETGSALVALAEISFHRGRYEEMLRWLDKVDALDGLDDRMRSAALGWRSRVSWVTGRWGDALNASNSAVAALEGLPESPQLARALARRSQLEMLRNQVEAAEHSREAIDVAKRVGDAFAEANGRINLFTVLASNLGEPPDPDDVLAIVEKAAAVGALEESTRAVINFIWSAIGFLPAEQIEATAIAGLDGRPAPPSIASYVELSLIAKVLVPAGRWAEADARLDAIDPEHIPVAAKLVHEPVRGALALRRGDLETAAMWLRDARTAALESGEVQRIVPMACAVIPWLYLAGRTDELRQATDETVARVGDLWPVVLTTDPIARALDAAGETERLSALADSLAAASGPKVGRLGANVEVAESLVALREGRAAEAAERLGAAAAEERRLGFFFDGACIALDHARALDALEHVDEAARVRAEAEELLWALDCVNPF